MAHRIAVIAGDGIGPEVTAEALKVVAAVGVELDTVDYDLGGERYLRDGTVLPDEVLDELRGFDAILLGAVGTPEVPPGLIERGLLLKMRFELDQYINQRPFLYPERDIDFVVIRENTEGTYAGEGGFLRKGTPHEIATQGSVNTRLGVERCVRYAFELARSRPAQAPHAGAQDQRAHLRRRPLAAHVRRGRRRVPRRRPPPTTTSTPPASTSCSDPARYDVIVTDNLFGDILTDLGGAVSGGIGFASSGNLNPERTGPSMFEPVHGSAPDIAGQAQGQPGRRHPERRDDARLPRRGRRRRPHPQGVRRPVRLTGSTSEIGDAVAGRL